MHNPNNTMVSRPGWMYPTFVMLLVQTMTSVCVLTPAVLAPVAAADFGLPATSIGGFTSLVYIAAMISGTTSSAWIQRLGAVQLAVVTILAAGIGLGILTTSMWVAAVAGALVMGICYGHVNPISAYTLNLVSPPRWRPLIFSLKQTGVVLGGVIAGACVPTLIDLLHWRGAGLVVAAVAIATITVVLPLRPGFPRPEQTTPGWGFASARQSLALVTGDSSLFLFSLGASGFSGVQVSMAAFMVLFLNQELGLPLIAAGVVFAIGQIAGVIGRLFWGAASGQILSATGVLTTIGILSALSILMLLRQQPDVSQAVLMVVCFAVGFSTFGWNGVFIAEVTNNVAEEAVGLAVGGTQFFFFGGVVVFPALVGLIAQQTGFRMAFSVVIAIALVATTCLNLAGRRLGRKG